MAERASIVEVALSVTAAGVVVLTRHHFDQDGRRRVSAIEVDVSVDTAADLIGAIESLNGAGADLVVGAPRDGNRPVR